MLHSVTLSLIFSVFHIYKLYSHIGAPRYVPATSSGLALSLTTNTGWEESRKLVTSFSANIFLLDIPYSEFPDII